MSIIVRAFEPEDLAAALDLWHRTTPAGATAGGLTIDQTVDLLREPGSVALVAEHAGRLAGLALASASSVVGVLHLLRVDPDLTEDGVAGALLAELELRAAGAGARRMITHVRDGQPMAEPLRRHGFEAAPDLVYLERRLSGTAPTPSRLTELGGRMIDPGLWDQLKGMDDAKEVIERRVILPLAEPELALRHAVSTPRAVVLFGPPGTGKTTFAKGIASRLSWPFIEIHPSELAGDGADRQARALATAFDRILELPAAVMFVDEVEDIASMRSEERRVTPSVTNEFLKQIPRFREAPHHLLACATNWIGRLDQAFLRPGRFDYVLPVGPPDRTAREAIWGRYVAEITDEPVDVDALVDATDLFTPADIEFAARKAAQHAFEREHFERTPQRATTKDFLEAVENTRPTLSADMVRAFAENVATFARY